jgi:hypothetical protein
LDFSGSPAGDGGRVQQLSAAGAPALTAAGSNGFLTVISTMTGARLFRHAQLLLRFMAIRNPGNSSVPAGSERPGASRAFCAVLNASSAADVPGRLLTSVASESVYILLATNLMPALLAASTCGDSGGDDKLLRLVSFDRRIAFSKNITRGGEKTGHGQSGHDMSRICAAGDIADRHGPSRWTKNSVSSPSFPCWAGLRRDLRPPDDPFALLEALEPPGAIAGMIGGAGPVRLEAAHQAPGRNLRDIRTSSGFPSFAHRDRRRIPFDPRSPDEIKQEFGGSRPRQLRPDAALNPRRPGWYTQAYHRQEQFLMKVL